MKNKGLNMKIFFAYCAFVLLISILLAIGIIAIFKGYNDKEKVSVSYQEASSIDYKVYLKENNFFEVPYLEKDKTYITKLIDYIAINYYYNIKFSEVMNGEYVYYIRAIIEANKSENQTGSYWSKEYRLTENNTIKLENEDSFTINEKIDVNYDKYNDLLTEFKKQYGLSVDGVLKVELVVDSTAKDEKLTKPITTNSLVTLNIPLTKLAIETSIDASGNNDKNEVVEYIKIDKKIYTFYKIFGFIVILGALFLTFILFKIIYENKKKHMYERTLKKIISNYDGIMVSVSEMPSIEDLNVIKAKSFDELIDAHSEVRMPINYYHEKNRAKFVLINGNIAWLYILDKKDFKVPL